MIITSAAIIVIIVKLIIIIIIIINIIIIIITSHVRLGRFPSPVLPLHHLIYIYREREI